MICCQFAWWSRLAEASLHAKTCFAYCATFARLKPLCLSLIDTVHFGSRYLPKVARKAKRRRLSIRVMKKRCLTTSSVQKWGSPMFLTQLLRVFVPARPHYAHHSQRNGMTLRRPFLQVYQRQPFRTNQPCLYPSPYPLSRLHG